MARCMKCQTTSLRKVGGDPWQDRIRVEPEARLQMHAPLMRSNAAYWNHTTSPQIGESLRGQDHVNGALPGCPGGIRWQAHIFLDRCQREWLNAIWR
jgi:hypothetical protein